MLESNAKNMQEDIQKIGQDANNLLNEARAAADEKSADLRTRGSAMFDTTMLKAKEMQGKAVENSKNMMRNTDSYVHQNPWRAVTISAGIGLLLGLLFKQR